MRIVVFTTLSPCSEWLLPELTKAGYLGIYKKKTTEIFTGSSYAIDGCATFFRRDRCEPLAVQLARSTHAA